jgi:hypothetical protein
VRTAEELFQGVGAAFGLVAYLWLAWVRWTGR